ncbi:MAG: DUF2807 domain-containing protein [Dysgonamonadaceae bacterium]|jgi:hypothetical protein|nr:DUF2807 domain-containing protein [Dysgonamonadaceae bacterium]
MKHFTLSFVFMFMMLPVFVSCFFAGNAPVYGNHQLENKQIDITDYEEISLNISADVFYQQFSDSAPYLQIHTDENIFASLDVKVEGRKLIISAKKDSLIKPSKLTIYTCSRNLKEVKIAGSGDITLKGEVNAKDFDLAISGSGSLFADSLVCKDIEVRITGSGNAKLIGAGSHSSFKVTGSGDIQAYNFYVETAKCTVTGSGDIQVNVYKNLEAQITGSGDILYRGTPETVNSKITGSGSVRQTQ